MNHVFSYRPLPSNHFRVLSLFLEKGKPAARLDIVSFLNPSQYNAMSYCWGSEDRSETLICDGQPFTVSPALYTALQHLIRRASDTKIWIDAICIDQSSNAEKESQVLRMGEIYKNAKQVLVWLGHASKNRCPSPNIRKTAESGIDDSDLMSSDNAMDAMESLSKQLESIPNHIDLVEWPKGDIPDIDDWIWRAIGEIFSRPWFYRLWVLQEVVLAKDIRILCGSKNIPWATLVKMAYEIGRTGLSYIARDDQPNRTQKADGIVTVGFLDRLRRMSSRNEIDFADALRLGREKNVKEPVDRIYGLLGMADANLRDRVTLDYSDESRRDYWKVYEQFAKQYIPLDSNYALLSMVMSFEKHPELPSWCPNFNSQNPSTDDFSDNGYRAGYLVGEKRVSRVELSADSSKIIILGFRIDVIREVGEINWTLLDSTTQESEETLEWEVSCLKISQRAYKCSSDKIPAAHWRALIADFDKKSTPARQDLELGYKLAKQTWISLVDNTWNGFDDTLQHETNLRIEFLEALAVCPGRSFFRTDGDRIGRGPLDAKPGDTICAFYSAGPVFVLRYEEESNVAQLIGDAWVHGVMDLSLMNNQIKDEKFVIG